MRLYKLTDKDGCTYGQTRWGVGIEHTASGTGELCGPGWLHAYSHPLLAVLMNPRDAVIADPLMWEADGDVAASDHGLKVGCTRLRSDRIIPLPAVTTEQRVRFAVLSAKGVYREPGWLAWADGWLSDKDRSAESAGSAGPSGLSEGLGARPLGQGRGATVVPSR